MNTADRNPSWDERDSRQFIEHARFFVPDREEQIETLLSLIPPDPRHVVELCCGDGTLAGAVLDRFPGCTVHGFDGSEAMLDHARTSLARHGDRFDGRLFDLAKRSWRELPWQPDAILSSLAIHHLDAPGKRALYRHMARCLAPGGVLLIADLVKPATKAGVALAARAWDETVRRRSQEIAGDLKAYEIFRDERWNYYADPEPDPFDQPSPLFDQLRWLEEAGLAGLDVFWMKAGHAIFGGVKPKEI
ncbi:MAG TPA: class I SAM-dependent methyltransferase [Thermoanaerobaculia bacterium]